MARMDTHPRTVNERKLAHLRAIRPPPKVILITAYGDWDTYLAAMNEGAFDYLTKPLKRNQIVLLARHALEAHATSSGEAVPERHGGFTK